MSNVFRINIDGKTVEAPAGSTILDVARREGIYIPTLCHSPLLRPLENCRLCVVSVAGEKKYKAACSTPVAEGMNITTQSPELQRTRKLLLELLLDTHYGDCVAPCTLTCPANVDIQGYLALIRHGEYAEAVKLIKEKIPMPATIGRVCPHPCETACRRRLVEEPININHCKRFAADYEMNTGRRILPEVPPASGYRVAIIGGGPSGLSAAYYLRRLGHGATIFEVKDKLGGMLRYGIPEYRLPKKVLDWEIEGILSLGVEVKTGVRWGRDFTLKELKREGFNAIFLAIGAWASRKLGISGEELDGVVRGVDFLDEIAGNGKGRVKTGKSVAVIGGGNVAIDAARSALRLGAEKVTILYRRSRNEMPASHEEIEAAQEEGVEIQFLVAPTHIHGENGVVKSLEFIRMELGEPDASGRRRPVPVEGSEMVFEVDQVISAIGQYPQVPMPDKDDALSDLPLTRWGTIGGDPRSMHTGQGMVFVGGDVFRGPDTVVAALADGRKAAYSLDRYFHVGEVQPEPLHFNISKGTLESIDREPFSVLKTISREPMPELQTANRVHNFREVELGLGEEQARREAGRCLVCGCSAAFDCRLRELMNEFQVDWRDQPSKKIHHQRVASVDIHPNIALDPNKCIRCERCYVACETFQVSDAIDFKDWPRFNKNCVHCGLCVDLCPTGALMEKQEDRAVERLDWQTVKTHCIHCACGCELELKIKGERLVWISDGASSPPNWSSTCRQGRFRIYDPIWFGDRIVKPLVREKNRLKEVSWQKAIGVLLDGFRGIQEHHGSRALGALASPRSTNEALYLLQKWMRVGWKSHCLDFPGRVSQEKLQGVIEKYNGARGLVQELAGLQQVGAIFVCGDGIGKISPVVATMIRRASRNRKIPVWQLAGAEDELSSFCSTVLHAESGAWLKLLRSLMKELAASGKISEEMLYPAAANPHGGKEAAGNFKPSDIGISTEKWKALIRAFAAAPSVAFVFRAKLFDGRETSEVAETLIRLAAATGHLTGVDGAGVYPILSEINSAGALLMGISPHRLPGFVSLSDENGRKKFMDVWQMDDLPGENGLALEEALAARQIKGVYVQQASCLIETDAERWNDALSSAEFLVVQDSAPSPVLELAHVVLPTAGYAEQTGTVINQERRVLKLNRAFAAQGKSLADWEVLTRIMTAQGIPFPKNMAAIHQEMSTLVPEVAQVLWDKDLKERI